MSLNDLVLNDDLLTSLYGHSLVNLNKTTGASAAAKINFLGNNEKNIVIIMRDPDFAFLPDDQLVFLVKMLKACKLNIGDVALINQVTAPILLKDLLRQFKPSLILFLGVSPAIIGMTVKDDLFSVQPFSNGFFLQVPPLAELNSDTEEAKPLKSKLWSCLKQLFAIT
jgi:hypothetical protein